MPKKFKGENTKSVEAKARKAAALEAEKERKQKEAEDAFWQDDDKHIAKKQQRKANAQQALLAQANKPDQEDKEKKRQEQLEKKKEKQQLLEEEMASLKSAKPVAAAKMTRAEVEANQAKMAAEAEAARKQEEGRMHDEVPLEENINRMETEGDEARTVEDAISVLSMKEEKVDRHPEKRMKAAYAAFEDTNLPRLKAENPNLRLSQLKQMLKKEWMKSPENPMNQRTASNS